MNTNELNTELVFTKAKSIYSTALECFNLSKKLEGSLKKELVKKAGVLYNEAIEKASSIGLTRSEFPPFFFEFSDLQWLTKNQEKAKEEALKLTDSFTKEEGEYNFSGYTHGYCIRYIGFSVFITYFG